MRRKLSYLSSNRAAGNHSIKLKNFVIVLISIKNGDSGCFVFLLTCDQDTACSGREKRQRMAGGRETNCRC